MTWKGEEGKCGIIKRVAQQMDQVVIITCMRWHRDLLKVRVMNLVSLVGFFSRYLRGRGLYLTSFAVLECQCRFCERDHIYPGILFLPDGVSLALGSLNGKYLNTSK